MQDLVAPAGQVRQAHRPLVDDGTYTNETLHVVPDGKLAPVQVPVGACVQCPIVQWFSCKYLWVYVDSLCCRQHWRSGHIRGLDPARPPHHHPAAKWGVVRARSPGSYLVQLQLQRRWVALLTGDWCVESCRWLAPNLWGPTLALQASSCGRWSGASTLTALVHRGVVCPAKL